MVTWTTIRKLVPPLWVGLHSLDMRRDCRDAGGPRRLATFAARDYRGDRNLFFIIGRYGRLMPQAMMGIRAPFFRGRRMDCRPGMRW